MLVKEFLDLLKDFDEEDVLEFSGTFQAGNRDFDVFVDTLEKRSEYKAGDRLVHEIELTFI